MNDQSSADHATDGVEPTRQPPGIRTATQQSPQQCPPARQPTGMWIHPFSVHDDAELARWAM
jgi:hypothetical protein